MVHRELSNKNPKTSAYQSSTKDEEGLTRGENGIKATLRYCDRD
jgi:hypothetical protein